MPSKFAANGDAAGRRWCLHDTGANRTINRSRPGRIVRGRHREKARFTTLVQRGGRTAMRRAGKPRVSAAVGRGAGVATDPPHRGTLRDAERLAFGHRSASRPTGAGLARRCPGSSSATALRKAGAMSPRRGKNHRFHSEHGIDMGCNVSRSSSRSPAVSPAHDGAGTRRALQSNRDDGTVASRAEAHEHLRPRTGGPAGSLAPRNLVSGSAPNSSNTSRATSFCASPVAFDEPVLFVHELVKSYSHKYSREAKLELKNRISGQGRGFRTTAEERQEFKRAFLAYVKTARLTTPLHRTPQAVYADYAETINRIKSANADVRSIPTEDLIALRAWTATVHYPIIMDALEGDEPPNNPLGISYVKGIVSALNALPDRFIHHGPAHTGEDRAIDWALAMHEKGRVHTNWSFLASSSSKDRAWQDRSVEWETHSVSGKNIALFSLHAHEAEVLFPPGTKYLTTDVQEHHSPRHFLSIRQQQIA